MPGPDWLLFSPDHLLRAWLLRRLRRQESVSLATWLNGKRRAEYSPDILGCLALGERRKPSRTQSETICSSCVGFRVVRRLKVALWNSLKYVDVTTR